MELSTLLDWIQNKWGLDFSQPGQRQLVETAWAKWKEKLKVQSKEEVEKRKKDFAESLLIGETYFFRHFFQYQALKRWLQHQPLREKWLFWSAGCATGEEAYSIAIWAEECLGGQAFHVIGTDVCRRFLEHARQGKYQSHSFRSETPKYIQTLYFQPTEDGGFQILDRLKQQVEFRYLNLLEPSYGFAPHSIDVIFLRNVMLYWHSDARQKVLEQLREYLHPNGLLVVSPCENYEILEQYYNKQVIDSVYFYTPKKRQISFTLPPLARSFHNPLKTKELHSFLGGGGVARK